MTVFGISVWLSLSSEVKNFFGYFPVFSRMIKSQNPVEIRIAIKLENVQLLVAVIVWYSNLIPFGFALQAYLLIIVFDEIILSYRAIKRLLNDTTTSLHDKGVYISNIRGITLQHKANQ